MNRFYVDKAFIFEKNIHITDQDDIHHIVKVLRLKVGEDVFVSDGDGSSYIAAISGILRPCVELVIKERLKKVNRYDRKINISLACAVPKKTHFEDVVDKCTQLGADEIIPLITERTLIEKNVFNKKLERYKRVMLSAAKQSGVLFLPQLKPAMDFNDILKNIANYDLCLIPNLAKKNTSLKDVLVDFKGKSVLILIGPEGDFSPSEIETVFKAGGMGVSLGESVLRVDTAAIAVVGFVSLFFMDAP